MRTGLHRKQEDTKLNSNKQSKTTRTKNNYVSSPGPPWRPSPALPSSRQSARTRETHARPMNQNLRILYKISFYFGDGLKLPYQISPQEVRDRGGPSVERFLEPLGLVKLLRKFFPLVLKDLLLR